MNKPQSAPAVSAPIDLGTYFASDRGSAWKVLPLYLGFAAAGIGVALPGVMLPILLARWSLPDEGGGNLFFVGWIGSSLGALLLSGSMLRALSRGSAAVALAALGLSLCPAWAATICMFIYGLGLGTVMTSISLLIQKQAGDSGRALVRLNLLWALGASLCPVLVLRTLRTGDLRSILYPLALLFVLLASWAILQGPSQPRALDRELGTLPLVTLAPGFRASFVASIRTIPKSLIVLVMLTTGVEASAGAWLATYAKRGGDPFSQIVVAPTCFWAGLLLSRLFWSFAPRAAAERWIIRGSYLAMSASALTLLVSPHGWPFFLAAACLGFGIGPVYPLLLAAALRFHSGGGIFFLAGVGSALLPWLTGFVSTQRGSLHAGFAVPAVATLLMVALSFAAPLPDRSS
jgi:FHS family glucose/mannose:H+ symporter-like MFS transporter